MPAEGPKTRAPSKDGGFRIDIDLEHAEREAKRIAKWLGGLRARHDLTRYEYTRYIRIVPASTTHSHPMLTLGTRFTETEDHLLATYLHEQMHWYLWLTGGPDHDPVAPFFDELVRRYPKAPTHLPEGARNYEQTYVHLVVNWLELKATSDFIGWDRAVALANTQFGYRWIYRTVVKDWDALGALFEKHALVPIKPAGELIRAEQRRIAGLEKTVPKPAAPKPARQAKTAIAKPRAKVPVETRASSGLKAGRKAGRKAGLKADFKAGAGRKKTSAAKPAKTSRQSPRKPPGRGGRSRG